MRIFKLLVLVLVVFFNTQGALAQKAYVFTYFDNSNESAGMCIAVSYDGYHWTAMNNNKPILHPEVGKDKLLRDPSVCQAPDGTFHMVWTTSCHDKGKTWEDATDRIALPAGVSHGTAISVDKAVVDALVENYRNTK